MAIDKEKFADTANERYQKAREFWRHWRTLAMDDYAFISGDQWLKEDVAKLDAEDRPDITFNYSEKMIDAVVGAEVGNRQEAHYAPRGPEDRQVAELWNSAAKWVRSTCNAEDEESDAFRDALICGLGWTWTRLSYEEDLDGRICVERVDPLEMFPDPAGSRPGLMDRRWQDRLWWVDEIEVKRQWPDAIFSIDNDDANTGIIRQGHRYSDPTMDEADRHKGQVQIRLHETYQMEDVYRVAMPQQDQGSPQPGLQLQEMSAEDFAKIRDQIPDGQFVKQRKRVYYRAYFAGSTLLEVKKSPCQDGFCFQAITAKRDRNRNTWYGLTRVMKDPQRWANKWLSQILHIVNSNAKGGLMAEIGAFVDPTRAQDEWSSPESITMLNEGGLQKVEQKNISPYPSGLDKLMSFALNSLPMVTGINLEALGLANREQAGVLEQQRKQAAYGLLAPIFDGQRRYRKEQGRILLHYIHHYISDGRMIRIGGPDSEQFLPLTKAPGALVYDVVVDQAPNAPDMQEKTWATLTEIIPSLLKANIPLPPDILDFTPLPTALTTKWKQFIEQSQQMHQQAAQQVQQVQQDAQKEIQKLREQLQAAQQDTQNTAAELALQQEKDASQASLEERKAKAHYDLEAKKQDLLFQLKEREQNKLMQLKEREQAHGEYLNQKKVNNDHTAKMAAATGTDNETDLSGLLTEFAHASADMVKHTNAGHDAMAQAVANLTDALTKPRRLVFDAKGLPVGVETGTPTKH